jgi:hypothetical protein
MNPQSAGELMKLLLAVVCLLLLATCSIPTPEAPRWEVPVNVPLVGKTVRVRELIDSESSLLWGDYGPFRLMDTDSVLTSQVLLTLEADEDDLLRLPTQADTTLLLGPENTDGNPLDELAEPQFRRAWFELVIEHTLPGSLGIRASVQGWDDGGHSCGPVELEMAVEPWDSGQPVRAVRLWSGDDVLAFVNPAPSHGVPEYYQAEVSCTYMPFGTPVETGALLRLELSALTALDLSFQESVLLTRADVETLIISPEGTGQAEGDVSGDITEHLKGVTLFTDLWNNVPAGGTATLRLAKDSSGFPDSADVIVGPFEIGAAPRDPFTGRPTGVTPTHNEATLAPEEVALFQNPGPGYDTLYAAVEYVLEGTATEWVCICAPDSIRSHAWAVLDIAVNPEDELGTCPPKPPQRELE